MVRKIIRYVPLPVAAALALLPLLILAHTVAVTIQQFNTSRSNANLKVIGHCLALYAQENGRLPAAADVDGLVRVLVPRYVPKRDFFVSPFTHRYYDYNRRAAGKRPEFFTHPNETPFLYERIATYGPCKGYTMVLMMDSGVGYVKMANEERWERLTRNAGGVRSAAGVGTNLHSGGAARGE